MSNTEQRLREVLSRLVYVIEAAGISNLSRGVQLGQISWFHKAEDAMQDAKSALAAPETGDGAIRCPEKLKPGGCQLHNLQCGWPKCNEPEVAQPAEEPATRLSGEDAKRMGLETCPVCDAAMHCPNCGCISVAQPSPREPESRVIDEAALERLFERGAVAWAGVQSQPSPREQEHAGEAPDFSPDRVRALFESSFLTFFGRGPNGAVFDQLGDFWLDRLEDGRYEMTRVDDAWTGWLAAARYYSHIETLWRAAKLGHEQAFAESQAAHAALRTAAQPEHAPQAEAAEREPQATTMDVELTEEEIALMTEEAAKETAVLAREDREDRDADLCVRQDADWAER